MTTTDHTRQATRCDMRHGEQNVPNEHAAAPRATETEEQDQ